MNKLVTQVGKPITARTPGGEATQILWKTEEGDYIVTSAANNQWASETMVFSADKEGDIIDYSELGVADFGDHAGALEDAGYTIDWSES